MGSSTSAITPPTFSGSSTFSSSFQQVLTRAVQIASLPMQQTQNEMTDLGNQQTALTQLESVFQSLDSAVQAIGSSSSGKTSATVSDPTSVSASTTTAALPGTYSIQVDTLGSSTTTLSAAGTPTVTDPTTQNISSATSFTLTVNGNATTITPSDGSLEGLVNAINTSDAGVQATIVNLGSNSSPDYRLVVTGTDWNNDTIQLSDGTSDLLNTISTGAPATYSVNGSNTVLQTTSPQVTLSPGLTVTLLGTTTQPDTITVGADYSGLQSALSSFATAYNAAFSAVEQQVGQNGGVLSGQTIVYTLQNMLQNLAEYSSSGSGSVVSLNDLGLTVDQNGQMSFDSSVFGAANPSAVAQFLGSATSGGFLQTASSALTSVDDTSSGNIETDYAGLQNQIDRDNQTVTDDQARITLMQNTLMSELTQADAAIATLQSQKTYFADLFQAEYPSTPTS